MRVLLLLLVVLPFCYSYSNAQVNPNGTTTDLLGNGWTGNVVWYLWYWMVGWYDQGDIHHGYDQSTGMGNTGFIGVVHNKCSQTTIAINQALQGWCSSKWISYEVGI